MKSHLLTAGIVASLNIMLHQAQGQPPAGQAAPGAQSPRPSARTTQFPMAAPAGKDSGATPHALPGAGNKGLVDPARWKYGGPFDPPPNTTIWNPVKLKMAKPEVGPWAPKKQ